LGGGRWVVRRKGVCVGEAVRGRRQAACMSVVNVFPRRAKVLQQRGQKSAKKRRYKGEAGTQAEAPPS